MTLTIVVLAVLLCATASAASYFVTVSRVLAKVVRQQERRHRRDSRRTDALLDRLVMRHGFAPLTESVKTKDIGAVISLPIADPFESAEALWEKEDRERFHGLSEEEQQEIAAAAQARRNGR